MDVVSGVYRVVTEASEYVVDLDGMLIRRNPRIWDPDGALLRHDLEVISLVSVVECSVGRPMILNIDLHVPGVVFTTRRSTPVQVIEAVAGGLPVVTR